MYVYIYICICEHIYLCVRVRLFVYIYIFIHIYIYIYICAYACIFIYIRVPTYSRAKAGRPARTYIQQLCEVTGCRPEDLPEAMNDREKWRERVRDTRACDTT